MVKLACKEAIIYSSRSFIFRWSQFSGMSYVILYLCHFYTFIFDVLNAWLACCLIAQNVFKDLRVYAYEHRPYIQGILFDLCTMIYVCLNWWFKLNGCYCATISIR